MQTDRMKALTDGVLAIVVTILVLSFEVPDHDFKHDGLIAFLARMAEPLIAYVVSFGIVSAYWMQHAAIYHYVTFGSRSFFWINLIFLLPVTLLPFLTELRATYHDEYLVTILYAAANVASGLLLIALWRHGIRRRLAPNVDAAVDRSMQRRILLGVAINVLGAAIAPIDTHLSSLVFISLPLLYVSHRVVDIHWRDVGSHDESS
jgi:uncharacterized membrane protein